MLLLISDLSSSGEFNNFVWRTLRTANHKLAFVRFTGNWKWLLFRTVRCVSPMPNAKLITSWLADQERDGTWQPLRGPLCFASKNILLSEFIQADHSNSRIAIRTEHPYLKMREQQKWEIGQNIRWIGWRNYADCSVSSPGDESVSVELVERLAIVNRQVKVKFAAF